MSKTAAGPSTQASIEKQFRPFQDTINHLWTCFAEDALTSARSSTIMVTGTELGAGATTVACCTVLGLAHHLQVPTILVETHPGGLSEFLGLPPGPGLCEVIDGSVALQVAVRDPGVSNLSVLPYGSSQTTVSTPGIRDLFDDLAQEYRYLVLDTPPVLRDPVTRVMLRHVDRALLVLRSRRSFAESARHAVEVIQESGTELVGTVLNQYRREVPRWLLTSKWDV